MDDFGNVTRADRLPSLATEVKVEALLAAARDVYGPQAIAAISTGAR
jgi:hypothetical protein